MPRAYIVTRDGATGRRYLVRFRLAAGETPRHAGSFPTLKEAKTRRDAINLDLAALRVPDLHALEATPRRRRLADVAQEWLEGRIDLPEGTNTRRTYSAALRRLGPLSDRNPPDVSWEDVQAWVTGLAGDPDDPEDGVGGGTIRLYIGVLRQVLDHAGLQPNPARDKRIRLPAKRTVEVNPPSRAQVAAIVRAIGPRWALAVRVLEATGMRVGELVDLRWGRVESRRGRWLVARGKTRAARRWITPPAELFAEVDALVAREDRVPERRVFPQVTDGGLRQAMTRACVAAGIPHFHPHDLRHRFVSRLVAQGLSIPEVAKLAGHSRGSLTIDVYSHVLTEEDDDA